MFANMKIGVRLGLGYGLLVVLMAVLIWEGVHGMSGINASLERIVKVNTVRILLANDSENQIATVKAPLPPSRMAIRFSRTSLVGLVMRV